MSGVMREIKAFTAENLDVALFTSPVEFVEYDDGKEPRLVPVAEEDFTKDQRRYLSAKYGRYFRRQDISRANRVGGTEAQEQLKAIVAAFHESVEAFNAKLPDILPVERDASNRDAVSSATILKIQGELMTIADQLNDINEISATVDAEQATGEVPGAPAVPVTEDADTTLATEGGVADAGGADTLPAEAEATQEAIAHPAEPAELTTAAATAEVVEEGKPV